MTSRTTAGVVVGTILTFTVILWRSFGLLTFVKPSWERNRFGSMTTLRAEVRMWVARQFVSITLPRYRLQGRSSRPARTGDRD